MDSSADWISDFENLEKPRRAYEENPNASGRYGENRLDHGMSDPR